MYGNLKIFRESLGMTQKEFAASLSIGLTTYNGYETGARDPKSDFWVAVATKYHVTIDYLMGFSNDPHKTSDTIKNAPLYSSEALRLAGDYDWLDEHGKRILRLVTDEEKARLREDRTKAEAALREQRERIEAGKLIDFEKVIRFSVPGYSMPLSAGTGQEAGQEYPENYTLIKEPPRGTSFIARVSGNSMEPSYYDGDLVFVHSAEEIPVGSIGVFYMDGQQWIKELGDEELVSHNPDPQYAPRAFTDDIRCQGLVLGVCDESYFE